MENFKLLAWAIMRWFIVMFIVGFVQLFSYTFIIPALALLLRKLGKWSPLWIFVDDTRLDVLTATGLAEDYRIYLKGYKQRWWGTIMWHSVRNKAWNLLELFTIPKYTEQGILSGGGNQRIYVLKHIHDSLYTVKDHPYCRRMKQDGEWCVTAGLKYVPMDIEDDPWQVNRGDVICYDTSVLGRGEILYKTLYNGKSWVGWRYSSCTLKRVWWLFGARRYITVFCGTNSNRYSFKYKVQKIKPWGYLAGNKI